MLVSVGDGRAITFTSVFLCDDIDSRQIFRHKISCFPAFFRHPNLIISEEISKIRNIFPVSCIE